MAKFLITALITGLLMPLTGEAQVTLVPRLATWSYEATGTDLGTAWRDTTHDDSEWPSDPGILGYGESYITTTVPFGPDSNNKYRTTYFRTPFTFSGDTTQVTSLVLWANFDDSFAAYINGHEVTRQNLIPGANYSTFASGNHEGGSYEAIDLASFRHLLVSGSNLLAVEVHQVTSSSSDLVMDMELVYSDLPAMVTRGPYLQVGTTEGVTIRWRTDAPTDSRVVYGSAVGNLVNTVTDPIESTQHEIVLTGLSPDDRYYYAVGTGDTLLVGDTSDYFFDTSPLPGTATPVRAWLIGDSGTANASAAAVRNAYTTHAAGRDTDVWIMLGDNAYNIGTDEQYQAAVFDMYPDILRNTVLWPTRGNHDLLHSGINNDYYEIFTLPTQGEAGGLLSNTEAYYSFDYANAHFVCLDSQGSDRSPGGSMLTWLAADLSNTTQDWIIAFWHHPPYTEGSHTSDDSTDSGRRLFDMRENALPILEAGGVDVVFCGHSHSYERSFLLDGHYGVSSTLTGGMIVDGGDGDPLGDGPYSKSPGGPVPNQGAVYVVAGSSGKISGGPLDHPVMVSSLNLLGSVVMDIRGNQLDAVFLDSAGNEQDQFTMIKGTVTAADSPAPGPLLTLSPGYPNPFARSTRLNFRIPAAGPVRLTVYGVTGRRIRTVVDGHLSAGDHEATWDGHDATGRAVGAGVYFSVLEYAGTRRTRRLIVRP